MKDNLAGNPVVVGVDGSASALEATALAAGQAARDRHPLLLLSALIFQFIGPPADARLLGQAEREEAARILATAAARALSVAPDVEIRTRATAARPAAALVAASRRASVVVLGAHGHGALADVLAGAVAVQVATHAHGPVLVARGTGAPDGDVVVGADGSAHGAAAVEWAFDEAERRGCGVTAVHAWRRPLAGTPGRLLRVEDEEREAVEIETLGESLSEWRAKYPDVPLGLRVARGTAASALVEASARAELVVVGARGHGGFTGLLLGSVGQALIHRAHCPVAIVRPRNR